MVVYGLQNGARIVELWHSVQDIQPNNVMHLLYSHPECAFIYVFVYLYSFVSHSSVLECVVL